MKYYPTVSDQKARERFQRLEKARAAAGKVGATPAAKKTRTKAKKK